MRPQDIPSLGIGQRYALDCVLRHPPAWFAVFLFAPYGALLLARLLMMIDWIERKAKRQ